MCKRRVSSSHLARPASESWREGGRGQAAPWARARAHCGAGRPALTWFLRYHAPDREPLPELSAPYVKFRDSSSRAAEAPSWRPASASVAIRSHSVLGRHRLPAPPLRAAPRRRRAQPRPRPSRARATSCSGLGEAGTSQTPGQPPGGPQVSAPQTQPGAGGGAPQSAASQSSPSRQPLGRWAWMHSAGQTA